jgi:hypothetical protein
MITIDGTLLAGVWIAILVLLAYDVIFTPAPAIIYAALIAFILLAIAGLSWRRYCRRQLRSMDEEQMRRTARHYGQKDGE